MVFLFVCVLGAFVSRAQSFNDIPVKDIEVSYVQIVGTSRTLSNKVTIEIDFGQENKLFSSDRDTRVKDASEKNMVFNSMIDALNIMTSNGYEFVQAYAFAVSNQNVYHYLLKKKEKSINIFEFSPRSAIIGIVV